MEAVIVLRKRVFGCKKNFWNSDLMRNEKSILQE